ncbi:patatin-like phospholipase domain-containing protein 4 isoform X2 [Acropora palmata]|uniref:patatin-like phospholipase domain-containing protein 4 isoform X2 n=1 Tax=Acropora palmata TaxID=6131 RepID=UPI003DA141BF
MSDVQDLNLTFSGCGFLGLYHLGVISSLRDNAPALLKRVKCYGGASAGGFAAMALLLDLSISDTSEFVVRIVKRANQLTLGTLHPSFDVVGTLRRTFERIVPENAHKLVNGKLHISLTRVCDMQNVVVSEFASKEELIEVLLATSFVPLWSGVLPMPFRGKYYVDGGITDNLPQHFSGVTITVSPFSGQCDICPKDGSSNDAHIDFMNTSVQVTLQNLYRASKALFPPQQDTLFKMCVNGYRDTLTFLRAHYPDMLKKRVALPPPPLPLQYIPETLSTSESVFSSWEEESLSSSGSSEIDTDEEGESNLVLICYGLCQKWKRLEIVSWISFCPRFTW